MRRAVLLRRIRSVSEEDTREEGEQGQPDERDSVAHTLLASVCALCQATTVIPDAMSSSKQTTKIMMLLRHRDGTSFRLLFTLPAPPCPPPTDRQRRVTSRLLRRDRGTGLF